MPRVVQRNPRSLTDVHRCTSLIIAVCLMAALLVSPARVPGASETRVIEASHRGITLIVLPARPSKKYDVSLFDQDQALLAIQGALDLIFAKSPSSSEKIDVLKSNGQVIIIYDPNFPWKEITTITMAAFMPKIPEFLVEEYSAVFGKFYKKAIREFLFPWSDATASNTRQQSLLGQSSTNWRLTAFSICTAAMKVGAVWMSNVRHFCTSLAPFRISRWISFRVI